MHLSDKLIVFFNRIISKMLLSVAFCGYAQQPNCDFNPYYQCLVAGHEKHERNHKKITNNDHKTTLKKLFFFVNDCNILY